jgi:hypothetical protein
MANLSAEEPDALMRARPGLREPRAATPGATQPDAPKRILLACFGHMDRMEVRCGVRPKHVKLPAVSHGGRRPSTTRGRVRGGDDRW